MWAHIATRYAQTGRVLSCIAKLKEVVALVVIPSEAIEQRWEALDGGQHGDPDEKK